jgi:hypothetical protein
MNDFTKTVVLPDNALEKARKPRRDPVDGDEDDFAKTLVLEDELDKRRQRRAPTKPAR